MTAHHCGRVPPFGHPRITARLAAPRGLSQPPTSFVGPWCQGIHRTPSNTSHNTTQQQHTKNQRNYTPGPAETAPGRCSTPTMRLSNNTPQPGSPPPPAPHPGQGRRTATGTTRRGPLGKHRPEGGALSGPNSAPTTPPPCRGRATPRSGAVACLFHSERRPRGTSARDQAPVFERTPRRGSP